MQILVNPYDIMSEGVEVVIGYSTATGKFVVRALDDPYNNLFVAAETLESALVQFNYKLNEEFKEN